jgi:histone-lysine N-methyltransferase SETMAR
LDRIVTCDEKWILYDGTKSGVSSSYVTKGERPPQTPRLGKHAAKVMVMVWWTAEGVIHHSYLQPGQTMNAVLYCEEIKIMDRKLRRMKPYLTKRKGPILLYDNARPHSAEITKNLLMELGYDTLDHPPYSPDLSPTDYHLFFHLAVFLSKKKYNYWTGQKSLRNFHQLPWCKFF